MPTTYSFLFISSSYPAFLLPIKSSSLPYSSYSSLLLPHHFFLSCILFSLLNPLFLPYSTYSSLLLSLHFFLSYILFSLSNPLFLPYSSPSSLLLPLHTLLPTFVLHFRLAIKTSLSFPILHALPYSFLSTPYSQLRVLHFRLAIKASLPALLFTLLPTPSSSPPTPNFLSCIHFLLSTPSSSLLTPNFLTYILFFLLNPLFLPYSSYPSLLLPHNFYSYPAFSSPY